MLKQLLMEEMPVDLQSKIVVGLKSRQTAQKVIYFTFCDRS